MPRQIAVLCLACWLVAAAGAFADGPHAAGLTLDQLEQRLAEASDAASPTQRRRELKGLIRQADGWLADHAEAPERPLANGATLARRCIATRRRRIGWCDARQSPRPSPAAGRGLTMPLFRRE